MQKPLLICAIMLLLATTAHAQDEETRKHLLHELAGPFIVFRANVENELNLSVVQKQKMRDALPGHLEEAMKTFETLDALEPREREQRMSAVRQKAGHQFTATLKNILTTQQLGRLQQLQLQHEGPGALGRPEIRKELKITQAQLMQFASVIQEMQKKIEPLVKEAQSGGNPDEIRPKAIKIRKLHEARIESLMTADQREKWNAMRGKPVDVLTD